MCYNVSGSGNTWSLYVFFGIINTILINVHVIHVHNVRHNYENSLSRREFVKQLSKNFGGVGWFGIYKFLFPQDS